MTEEINVLSQRVNLAELDLQKKLYDNDYEKNEKKLVLKLEEKLQDIKE